MQAQVLGIGEPVRISKPVAGNARKLENPYLNGKEGKEVDLAQVHVANQLTQARAKADNDVSLAASPQRRDNPFDSITQPEVY